MAFAKMSSVFADNPPGLLPRDDATTVGQVYMQYRENYNSTLENCCLFGKVGWDIWLLSVFGVSRQIHARSRYVGFGEATALVPSASKDA